MKRNEFFNVAEKMYVEQFITEAEIGKRLGLSDRTIRRWKAEGEWGDKRKKFIKSIRLSNNDIYTFARKMLNDFEYDMEKGRKLDASRMYIFLNLVDEMLKNNKKEISLKELRKIAYRPRHLLDESDFEDIDFDLIFNTRTNRV